MTPTFVTKTKVRFAHVDPAGIVFYPRYFEMLNGAVEDWFGEVIHTSFSDIHFRHAAGVPTVNLQFDFRAPAKLGMELEISLTLIQLGRTSCQFEARFMSHESLHLDGRLTLVMIDLGSGRSVEWPEPMRSLMQQQLMHAPLNT